MTEDTSASSGRLYIYVKNWETHQPRSDKPGLPWIRMETRLLGDDAWLGLEPADSKLLVTIWLLSQRYGHGRVIASLSWLQAQANLPVSNRYRGLERLIQAGLITLSSTQAPHTVHPKGVLDKNRREKEEKERSAHGAEAPADFPENGKPKISPQRAAELQQMMADKRRHREEAGLIDLQGNEP